MAKTKAPDIVVEIAKGYFRVSFNPDTKMGQELQESYEEWGYDPSDPDAPKLQIHKGMGSMLIDMEYGMDFLLDMLVAHGYISSGYISK